MLSDEERRGLFVEAVHSLELQILQQELLQSANRGIPGWEAQHLAAVDATARLQHVKANLLDDYPDLAELLEESDGR